MKYISKHLFSLALFLFSMNHLQAQDQGMTSETHSKYVGKIVFASDPTALNFKNENPSKFKTSFSADEPIYSKIYLAKSLANTPYQNGDTEYALMVNGYKMTIDGKPVEFKRTFGDMQPKMNGRDIYYYTELDLQNMASFKEWTTWRHFLLPKENDEELKYGNRNISARAFTLALLDLEEGTHNVKIELYGHSMTEDKHTEPVATGEFEITLTAEDKKNLAFKYAAPLPKDKWQGGNKEQILKELAVAFENEFKEKPLYIGILDADWKEGTYSLNGQKYRKISAYAVWADKDGDGMNSLTGYNWISDYSSGSWTKLRFDSHCNTCPRYKVEYVAIKALAEG
ncbi:hypothetical protein [Bernardetia sp.]|uniref:hypothetical protein n=1 Tax=Bernardetia sp. TaxID=1937974 RepID=UPI0025BCA926|nr:hypothetical protein [Bernardetia sp.]